MKNSNLTTRAAMGVLLLGVLVYFGFYILNSFSIGLTTVLAYEDTVNVGIGATGLVVRQERVLTAPSSSSTVDLIPSEGEKVAGGQAVATLYASSAGLETKSSISTLEAEIEQLEYALRSSASPTDSSRVEGDLLAAIAHLHASAASGDLTGLEGDALQLRTLLFKRDYTFGDVGAAQELQSLIADKTDRLTALRASLGSAATVVRAPQSGVFSGLADGFESLIGPDMLDQISPSQLSRLLAQDPAPPGDAIGKLITSSTWWFAAIVSEEEAASLQEGSSYDILFSHDYSGQVPMTLERISDGEEGSTVLIFSCRTDLSQITLLRRQQVDIVTRQIHGIRIPRSTLRALTQTVTRKVTDQATGEERTVEEEVTVTGVYTVPSRQAEFTPVDILYQADDFFLVAPSDPDAARRLREGDEIIVYTAGVVDGKVVR